MKTLLTIIILYFSKALLGQTKALTNVTYTNGDTSFWYKYQKIVIKDLSLFRLDTSTAPFHFRIWKTNQVLDIWQTSDASYAGQLTSWVRELAPTNEKPTGRTLIDKRILNANTLKDIISFIETSQIVKLPTDDSIKGWKHGFDGVTYIIEFSTKATYSFKTYWTPKAQDRTLAEAKYLQSFVDKIFDLSNGAGVWKQFEKNVPYECYIVGGTIRCKVLTKKQKKQFARERKNYR
jgi:hypothetical protein